MKGDQQTYLLFGDETTNAVTIGVGQHFVTGGVLSYGTPPASSDDCSHGIERATVNIHSLNSDGQTWTTVATEITIESVNQHKITTKEDSFAGFFTVTLTPEAAGVYHYRMTYNGNSQYAPAVSNVQTLTVTNVAIS